MKQGIEAFLYTYVNIIMKVKSDAEKATSIFAYLSWDKKINYKTKFISGWSLHGNEQNFEEVCNCLVSEKVNEMGSEEMICTAIEVFLHFSNWLSSLVSICCLYNKAVFDA